MGRLQGHHLSGFRKRTRAGARRGPNLQPFRRRKVCKARACAPLHGACITSTGRDAREVVHASREGCRLSGALRYGRVTAPRASGGSTRRRQLRGPAGEVAGGEPEGGAEPSRASRRLRRVSQPGRWGCVVACQAPRPEHKDGVKGRRGPSQITEPRHPLQNEVRTAPDRSRPRCWAPLPPAVIGSTVGGEWRSEGGPIRTVESAARSAGSWRTSLLAAVGVAFLLGFSPDAEGLGALRVSWTTSSAP